MKDRKESIECSQKEKPCRGTIQMTTDFSLTSIEVRNKWNDIFEY